MSNPKEPRSPWAILTVAGRPLWRLHERWRRRRELDTMDRDELERVAKDLGMTGWELKDLAARGPHAAHLLDERMRTLGLTRADVERVAYGLMRDLERTCARCSEKSLCQRDLATQPDDAAWQGYCPNADALKDVRMAKGHLAG